MIDSNLVASYADDNTPYTCEKNVECVLERLKQTTSMLFKWCNNNAMKGNPDKSTFNPKHKRKQNP